MQRCALFVIGVLLQLALQVSCFDEGAPSSTCLTMFPKHHTEMQTGGSPFKMKLSSLTYSPSQTVTVTFGADDKRPFRGVQLSAHRKSGNTEECLGTFVSLSPAGKFKTLNCLGLKNQVTHQNPSDTVNGTVVWKAPDTNVGDIIFKATFVENYETFWVYQTEGIKTADPNNVVLPPPDLQVKTVSTTFEDINFKECGSNKGCFLYPSYCHGDDCDAVVTYRKDGDDYTFEMSAVAEGYVSLGFSHDNVMGDDQTISCTAQNERVTVQNGYNPSYHNNRQPALHLKNLQVKQRGSKVMCRFTRPRILNTTIVKAGPPFTLEGIPFDLERDWFLMVGWGYTYYNTDVMGKHVELPPVTRSKVNFRSYVIHRGTVLFEEYQAHAALMVIAWIFLTGLTTVCARHYRKFMSSKILFGTKIWFQVHRFLSISVATLTAVSFIIIFVKVGDLSEDEGETHAVVGITLVVAVGLQILGGLLRPAGNAKYRTIFNWTHRLLGQGSHILAATNFLLAFNMEYIPSSMKTFGTVVVSVWIAFQVLWEIVFEIWKSRNVSGVYVTDSKKDLNEFDIQEPPGESRRTNYTYLFTILYFVTLLGFLVGAMCAIFLF